MKYKLGSLSYGTFKKSNAKDALEKKVMVRLIDLPRISVFTVEKTENRLVQIFQIPGYERFLFHPLAYHIDDKLRITMVYPRSVSLFEFLHDK